MRFKNRDEAKVAFVAQIRQACIVDADAFAPTAKGALMALEVVRLRCVEIVSRYGDLRRVYLAAKLSINDTPSAFDVHAVRVPDGTVLTTPDDIFEAVVA